MAKRQVKLPLWGTNSVPSGRQAEVRIPAEDAKRCAWIHGRGTFDGSRLYKWASEDELVRAVREAREKRLLLGGDPIPWPVDPEVRRRCS